MVFIVTTSGILGKGLTYVPTMPTALPKLQQPNNSAVPKTWSKIREEEFCE
jgi:hypothetical protein